SIGLQTDVSKKTPLRPAKRAARPAMSAIPACATISGASGKRSWRCARWSAIGGSPRPPWIRIGTRRAAASSNTGASRSSFSVKRCARGWSLIPRAPRSRQRVASSIGSAELRHEVPIAIPDPFLYVERNGRRVAVMPSIEMGRAAQAAGDSLEVLPLEAFGWDDIVRSTASIDDAFRDLVVRVCADLDVREAIVPGGFPLAIAETLRAQGVKLRVAGEEFR